MSQHSLFLVQLAIAALAGALSIRWLRIGRRTASGWHEASGVGLFIASVIYAGLAVSLLVRP